MGVFLTYFTSSLSKFSPLSYYVVILFCITCSFLIYSNFLRNKKEKTSFDLTKSCFEFSIVKKGNGQLQIQEPSLKNIFTYDLSFIKDENDLLNIILYLDFPSNLGELKKSGVNMYFQAIGDPSNKPPISRVKGGKSSMLLFGSEFEENKTYRLLFKNNESSYY